MDVICLRAFPEAIEHLGRNWTLMREGIGRQPEPDESRAAASAVGTARDPEARGQGGAPAGAPPLRPVTAVVVTFRRAEVAVATVESLLAQDPKPRVILVDNGCQGRGAWETLEVQGVSVVCAGENVGFAGGLELGMRLALDGSEAGYGGHLLWLLDDDSPVQSGSLERALGVLERLPSGSVLANRGARLRRGRIISREDPTGPEEVDLVLVDGTLIPADVVMGAGFPDRSFFMGFEDFEYSLRLRKCGTRLFIAPAVRSDARHLGSTSAWRCYYQSRNHTVTALRYRSPWLLKGALSRTAKQIIVAVLRHENGWRHAVAYRIRGTVDAFRGRMGRVVNPDSAR